VRLREICSATLHRPFDEEQRNRTGAAGLGSARGDVLDIGIGSGLNLPFYSGEVRRTYGVEPSSELQKLARKRSVGKAIDVEFLSQSAEEPLPLPDQTVDTVVVTWTRGPSVRSQIRQARFEK
jgi:ubiquinone/menaquinone biosynthesis C-methylase UbiE